MPIGSYIEQAIGPLETHRPTKCRKRSKIGRVFYPHGKGYRIFALAMVAMTTQSQARYVTEGGPFDTDSIEIGIDSRASGCISHVRRDFPGALTECKRAIKGFGGTRHFNVWTGTLKWSWEDDEGKQHTFSIPNSYYIPKGKVRLLSPQHWAQTRKGKDKLTGAGETTTGLRTTLYWNNGQSKRTVPIDRDGNNVSTFRMSTGYNAYHEYCKEAGFGDTEEEEQNPLTVDEVQGYITDSDDEQSISQEPVEEDTATGWEPSDDLPSRHTEIQLNTGNPEGGEEPPNIITDEEDKLESEDSDAAVLLRIHYSFGHTPFSKLQQMAKRGILPKRLSKCAIPICSACQYAKATKRKWRPKTAKDHNPDSPTKPGQVVSVDQLVSPTPGLIAQMTGFLTKKRYKYATVFVDQHSGMGFIYRQREASVEETLDAKRAFERYSIGMGVTIRNYHADNGIFKAKGWVDACHAKEQGLTFAAVGAHHSNGKA